VFDGSGAPIEAPGTLTYRGATLSGAPYEEGIRLKTYEQPYVAGSAIDIAARDAGIIHVVANGVQSDGEIHLPNHPDTWYLIHNASGYAITPKIGDGSGADVLNNGDSAIYYHNGVDYSRLS
jgi:hypothetical protein